MLLAILALGAPKAAHVDLSTEDVPRLRVFASGQELLWSPMAYKMHFGTPPRNLSAPVVVPPRTELCGPGNASWAGHIVLADDWTTPGCSTEARRRWLGPRLPTARDPQQ